MRNVLLIQDETSLEDELHGQGDLCLALDSALVNHSLQTKTRMSRDEQRL